VSCSQDIPNSELAVSLPLLHKCKGHLLPLDHFFVDQVALEAPLSMQACLELSHLAADTKDQAVLKGIGLSKTEYDNMCSLCGLKWLDLFRHFPSLSKQVSLEFLICYMKMNHPRSYSISSCKAMVGSELHIVVGRFLYSRGGSKREAGVCSTYLTSVEPGDEVVFQLESAPAFHYPVDPTSPIIFVCTGTGIAPIRGLLQQRSYLLSRGERIGQAFLIFGSRSTAEGLFHDEIRAFQEQCVLAEVFMCYSREVGQRKEYTTDKLRSNRVVGILRPILANPDTHVFICGSANMAEECKDALREISQDCFDALTNDGRLHCDVFGALSEKKLFSMRNSFTIGQSWNGEPGELDDLECLDELESSIREKPHKRGGRRFKLGERSASCIMIQAPMGDSLHSNP
jgi:sulfite reductase alpha subunit-like flavoprotein